MHTIKITPNLLFEYQCTSGKFIRLPNRIESNRNFFCPNWNALPLVSVAIVQSRTATVYYRIEACVHVLLTRMNCVRAVARYIVVDVVVVVV